MSELHVPTTIESDIAELEKQLAQKRAALEHEKSEKETLHEIVGEKIKEHIPENQPGLPSTAAPVPRAVESPSNLSHELKEKVNNMVAIVFSKSLEEGIKEAARSGNPALIDDFHDTLTDELYEQLIVKRKLDRVE